MVKEKGTRTCYYLLLIYEPQSIIDIPHASLFSIEWWVTLIQFQNLVQFRSTLSVPFYNRFHIIRGFDCNTELWVPFSVMVNTNSTLGAPETMHKLNNIMLKLTITKNSSKALNLHNKRIFKWAYMQEETLWHRRNDEDKKYKSFHSYIGNNW